MDNYCSVRNRRTDGGGGDEVCGQYIKGFCRRPKRTTLVIGLRHIDGDRNGVRCVHVRVRLSSIAIICRWHDIGVRCRLRVRQVSAVGVDGLTNQPLSTNVCAAG
jgi:hypothetical protein